MHGLRVLAIVWIMFGHTVAIFSKTDVSNQPEEVREMSEHFVFALLLNGSLAVDVFFVLSGCLLVYQATLRGGRLPLIRYYVHRYWRQVREGRRCWI